MQIGVCTAPENFTDAVDGIEFIEPSVANILCPAEDDAAFEQRLAAAKACPAPVEAVNCLIPGSMRSTGEDIDGVALDKWIDTVLNRAAAIGVKRIVYGSGGSRRVPDEFDHRRATSQIIGHLQRWGPMAKPLGITFVLEPLNQGECNIVNTVDEGADIVRHVNHPNVQLLIDTFHMALDGDPPEAIRRAGELVCHAHCAEADGRGFIGVKGEDHRPYFRALKDIGYAGRMSIEAKWTDFAAELPAAVEELKKQIESA